jgi:hypothetical protein
LLRSVFFFRISFLLTVRITLDFTLRQNRRTTFVCMKIVQRTACLT